MPKQQKIKRKKIEIGILIGRGKYCRCNDCVVLYGGKCPFDNKKFREEIY